MWRYMEDTALDVNKIMSGGLVAGTQTQADEAMSLVNSMLEPVVTLGSNPMLESWTGRFTFFWEVILDVPGTFGVGALTSGQPNV